MIRMTDICMSFGPVHAVKNVSLHIEKGKVYGLLGENGAGKSTLMNILGGIYPPTSGKIYMDGNLIEMTSPVQAARHKIRFVHQELILCNDLTVYENIFLGEELQSGLFLNKKEMIAQTQEVLDRMKSSIAPTALVGKLETAEKQLIEIAKALVFESRLIILDEPTTALGQQDIDQLFSIIRNLKKEGVAFIYISHKMPEIFEICDSYTVLRDGEFIAKGETKESTEREITDLMVGKELVDTDLKTGENYIQDERVMVVNQLSGEDFQEVSFSLNKGEILAITGLHGSGIGSLVDTLFGAVPFSAGTLSVNDYSLTRRKGIRATMKSGIAMMPRNRKERGILPDLSIYDNLSMASWNISSGLTVSRKKQKAAYEQEQKVLSIKAGSPENLITSLSGGNQQKVIFARWLETNADVYLLDNPTQGIDVGAKLEIYKIILELAKEGKGIIVFTNEFAEIYRVADRCIVFYSGRIAAEISRENLSEEDIIFYSTGGNREGQHGR